MFLSLLLADFYSFSVVFFSLKNSTIHSSYRGQLFITAGANSSEYIPNVRSVDDTLARWRFYSDKKEWPGC